MVKQSQDLFDALRALLMGRKASTQEAICHALEKQGYEINQSKVSRSLRKIGAIKVLDSQGQIVYSLPREPGPPSLNTPLRQLILDVVANEIYSRDFYKPRIGLDGRSRARLSSSGRGYSWER